MSSQRPDSVKCWQCDGSGKVLLSALSYLEQSGRGFSDEPYKSCSVCAGTGYLFSGRVICYVCLGKGDIITRRSFLGLFPYEGTTSCLYCGGKGFLMRNNGTE